MPLSLALGRPRRSVPVGFLGGNCGLVGDASGDRELVRGGGGGGTLRAVANCNSSAFLSGTGGFCGGIVPSETWILAIGGEVSVSELDGYECNRLNVLLEPGGARAKLVDESMLPFLPMSEIFGARPLDWTI